jgi:UDP-glucuronate 4-epimerase
MTQKKILVTGAAGFIGFHLVKSLILLNEKIIGIDNINDYYDPNLKFNRLSEVGIEKAEINWHKAVQSRLYTNYSFLRMNLEDSNQLYNLCEKEQFDYIIHLAAQAGVRYSLENPSAYIQSNLVGFGNILEASRIFDVKHLIYASSSSVYGMNIKIPFSTNDNVDYPISLYAATKKSNELMAHTYSHIYKIPTTGLRFFTVYGPWGRPDMAYFDFSKNITNGKEIVVYNNGKMKRDFTFISDIIDGILEVIKTIPSDHKSQINNVSSSLAPYRILNLGNNKPVTLLDFINTLEVALGKKAIIKFAELQKGDVLETWADISLTQKEINYNPKVEINQGLIFFTNWFKNYYINEIEK